MRWLLGVISSFAIFVSVASAAESWAVKQRKNGLCTADINSEPRDLAFLMIGMKDMKSVALAVSSLRWSVNAGEKYQLAVQIDDTRYEDATFTGMGGDLGNGYVITLPSDKLLSSLRRGQVISFSKGDEVVGEFSLRGSAVAIKQLTECVSANAQ